MKKNIFLALVATCLSTSIFADSVSTEKYFDSIKDQPEKLYAFLKAIPKGGDLHNHQAGSSMAEDMMRYARRDNLCLDETTFVVSQNSNCNPHDLLDVAIKNKDLKQKIIDAWSMQDFKSNKESGHDHFFNSFRKYGAISGLHFNNMLTEIVERAGRENEMYLELMVTPDNDASGQLGAQIGWNDDLAALRKKLLENNFSEIVNSISQNTTNAENFLYKNLFCGTSHAKPGCNVQVRYLYQVLRAHSKEEVFAQILAGFEVANKDPRFVGINLVQPEDNQFAMQDYNLHMRMIQFLRKIYPNVKVSLHAGELVPGLVPSNGLRFHIRNAVEIAHAERIGHGVDITHEDNYVNLLQEMAKQHVLVEINLTSNQQILGIAGKDHPISLYMQYNIPVSLSTDDEGVDRTNLTKEYEKAVQTYHFSYSTLKMFARNSITYNFVPGNSLWADYTYNNFIPACAKDFVGEKNISASCKRFLNSSEKARMQWHLEHEFNQFEHPY